LWYFYKRGLNSAIEKEVELKIKSYLSLVLVAVIIFSFPAFARREKGNTPERPILEVILEHFADPSGSNEEDMRAALRDISEVALRHLFHNSSLDGSLVVPNTLEDLKAMFQQEIPVDGSLLNEVLKRYEASIQNNNVNLGDPRYVAHMTPYPLAVPIFVELLISAVNANQIAFEASPASTFAELEVLRWLAGIVGYNTTEPNKDSDGGAVVGSLPVAGGSVVAGGTTANETAFLVARNQTLFRVFQEMFQNQEYETIFKNNGYNNSPDVIEIGLSEATRLLRQLGFSGRLIVLTSEAAHYSHQKLGGYLGIGSNNVIKIRTEDGKISPDALREQVDEHIRQGDIILAIAATMGTTEEGLYDPIKEIYEIAKDFGPGKNISSGIWLHADAAYGGAVKLSSNPEYKSLADGLELADSITIDPHKWFYMPYAMGVILFKDRVNLVYVKQSSAAEYAFRPDEEVVNLGSDTLQGSKRFEALKLWFALQLVGVNDYGRIIDHTIEQTKEIAVWLRDVDDFEVIEDSEINLFSFRFVPKEIKTSLDAALSEGNIDKIDKINQLLNRLNIVLDDELKKRGAWYFARTTLHNSSYRLDGEYQGNNNLTVFMNVNMNPFVNQEVLQGLFEEIANIGNSLEFDWSVLED